MNSYIDESDKSNGAFLRVLYRYLPYWPLFLLLVAICCFGAWYYIRQMPVLHEATVSILIKDEEDGAGDSKILESLDLLSSKKNVQNEIEIIRSRSMMKKVVGKLHLYVSVFEENGDKTKPVYENSPISIKAADPYNLKEVEKVSFSFEPKMKVVKINGNNYPLSQWVKTPFGDLKFEKKRPFAASNNRSYFFSIREPNTVANEIRVNLNIAPIPKTSMVVLKLKDLEPQRAKDILNSLAEAYNNSSLEVKNSLAASTLTFVNDRIKYVEDDLDSLERKIQLYKSREGIVDLGAQGNIFLQNLNANDLKESDINFQLEALAQAEYYVKSKDKIGTLVPSTIGIKDPLLSELLQMLYKSTLEYENLKKSSPESNPILSANRNEIEKIRASLLENIINQRKILTANLNKINADNKSYASRLSTLPQKEKALLDLSRRQAIKSSVYTFLLQKREETAFSNSAIEADNRLIDAAEAFMLPTSPSKPVVYMLAVILGLLAGIGLVSAKDLFNNKVLFRAEIESFTQLPVIAEISHIKEKATLVVHSDTQTFAVEQFRHLRAAMGLYGKIRSKRKLMITSSIAGEGKSFISANLALSLALAGRKAVLIDLDLRNPKTSEAFGLIGAEGIAEFLEGNKKPFEIIRQTDFEQLAVIPAGNSNWNSVELLLTGKLDVLLKYLTEHFDYIIADTSPVDPVSDASVLADYFDTTLFVIRHGYTPKTMMRFLDSNKKMKALKNLMIVFNGVKHRGFMNSGYGFGYGYGYEYIYKGLKQKESVRAIQD
jgi:tyrosine-protein kinase Etk/Wzc